MGVGMASFVKGIMQLSEIEMICNHMINKVIVSCEPSHNNTIVITLEDDSLIEISGEDLSVYAELTPRYDD